MKRTLLPQTALSSLTWDEVCQAKSWQSRNHDRQLQHHMGRVAYHWVHAGRFVRSLLQTNKILGLHLSDGNMLDVPTGSAAELALLT